MFVQFIYLGVVLFNLVVLLLLYKYRRVYPGIYNGYAFLLFLVNLVLCHLGCYGDKSFVIGVFTVAVAVFFSFLCIMDRRLYKKKREIDLILEALEEVTGESGDDDNKNNSD